MSIERFNIPTGVLFTDDYSLGKLETLSIGDYGKSKNIKAEFLGFNNEINGVKASACLPLSEKWVITLSTQYGCPMKCTFCDCHKIGFKGNATFEDLKQQFYSAILMFPEIKYTDRLNVHFARMGEPMFNFKNVYDFSYWLIRNKKQIFKDTGLRIETLHPVLTTCCPKGVDKGEISIRLTDWCGIKNDPYYYNGQAGLQLSINSTSDEQRSIMFNDAVLSLDDISNIGKVLPDPIGRKYCLNFAYCNDYEVDAIKLRRLFNPDKFMVKITPIHNNSNCIENNIKTIDGYTSYNSYRDVERSLINVGFDVLVFIPSDDEEKGLVTCGNAILSGSKLEV